MTLVTAFEILSSLTCRWFMTLRVTGFRCNELGTQISDLDFFLVQLAD
jgi:hypothetical protein